MVIDLLIIASRLCVIVVGIVLLCRVYFGDNDDDNPRAY